MVRALLIGVFLTGGCASAAASSAPPSAAAPAPPPTVAAAASAPARPLPEAQTAPAPLQQTSSATDVQPPAAQQSCNATISVEVQRELVARAVEVRRCYEQQLRRDPALRGRVVVSVRLSGRGVFESARLSKDELGKPELTSCILGHFSAPLSAQFDGDCADVNIPLRFEPKKAAPSEAGDANAASPPPPPG